MECRREIGGEDEERMIDGKSGDLTDVSACLDSSNIMKRSGR
jgi:hypothetical protein